MYKLGFCVYGPLCRFKHTRLPGPPPPIEEQEAAKPREFRNINLVVNNVNQGVQKHDEYGRTAGRGRGRWVCPSLSASLQPCWTRASSTVEEVQGAMGNPASRLTL